MNKRLSDTTHIVSILKKYMLLFSIIPFLAIIPVYAQVTPTPEDTETRETINGIPEEKLDCIFKEERGRSTNDCLPNKRIIIFAVYDKLDKDRDRGAELEAFLASEKDSKRPLVEETPLQKRILGDENRYEYVSASYEFANNETVKMSDIRDSLLGRGLASDAAYYKSIEFNTWHHFSENQQRECEITHVVEFGDVNVIADL